MKEGDVNFDEMAQYFRSIEGFDEQSYEKAKDSIPLTKSSYVQTSLHAAKVSLGFHRVHDGSARYVVVSGKIKLGVGLFGAINDNLFNVAHRIAKEEEVRFDGSYGTGLLHSLEAIKANVPRVIRAEERLTRALNTLIGEKKRLEERLYEASKIDGGSQ